MQRTKKLFQFLIILLSISILRCMTLSKNDPDKKEVKYLLAFANDPNGIAIYKNPKDLTSKIGVIPYKEKFEMAAEYDEEFSDPEAGGPRMSSEGGKLFITKKIKFQKQEGFEIDGSAILFNL